MDKQDCDLLPNGHYTSFGLELKECRICKRLLFITEFGTKKDNKDRLASSCKKCENARLEQYRKHKGE